MRAVLLAAILVLSGCNLFEQTAAPTDGGDQGLPGDTGRDAGADFGPVVPDMMTADLGGPTDFGGVDADPDLDSHDMASPDLGSDVGPGPDMSEMNCQSPVLMCAPVGAESGGQCTQSGPGSLVIDAIGDTSSFSESFMFGSVSVTGDFVIEGRVDAFTDRRRDAFVGLMARESTSVDSRFAHIHLTDGDGIWFSFRSQVIADEREDPDAPDTAWLRLERAGTTFTGSYSEDGTTWSFVGTRDIAMSDEILVGVALMSGDNEDSSGAVWSEIEICQ